MGEHDVYLVCLRLAGAAWAVECVCASLLDARHRRFPNALAIAFALTCALFALLRGGIGQLARNALVAAAVCALLTVFELWWRKRHGGRPGMGMGDIKFLGGYMLCSPAYALASFAGGLLMMLVACCTKRVRALPLLPFAVAAAGFLLSASLLAGGLAVGFAVAIAAVFCCGIVRIR